ncbi:MAG TPA: hypothetical protein VD862_04745 [Candidatus Paceibacterota bacterium]|nr:hypothetical protein [Candidatus Paceibacterota bacterium]
MAELRTIARNAGFVLAGAVLGSAPAVFAQLTTTRVQPSGGKFTFDRVVGILYGLAEFLIRAALVIAVIAIIWYAILIMLSGSNPARHAEAKKGIWWAIIGAAVILGVEVIIATIKGVVDSLR